MYAERVPDEDVTGFSDEELGVRCTVLVDDVVNRRGDFHVFGGQPRVGSVEIPQVGARNDLKRAVFFRDGAQSDPNTPMSFTGKQIAVPWEPNIDLFQQARMQSEVETPMCGKTVDFVVAQDGTDPRVALERQIVLLCFGKAGVCAFEVLVDRSRRDQAPCYRETVSFEVELDVHGLSLVDGCRISGRTRPTGNFCDIRAGEGSRVRLVRVR